jgi:hypothetical protein
MVLRDGYVGHDGLWPLLTGVALVRVATFLPFVVVRLLVPAAAPVVGVVERGGHRTVDLVRTGAAKATALAATAGAAAPAVMAAGSAASSAPARPRALPARPRPTASDPP